MGADRPSVSGALAVVPTGLGGRPPAALSVDSAIRSVVSTPIRVFKATCNGFLRIRPEISLRVMSRPVRGRLSLPWKMTAMRFGNGALLSPSRFPRRCPTLRGMPVKQPVNVPGMVPHATRKVPRAVPRAVPCPVAVQGALQVRLNGQGACWYSRPCRAGPNRPTFPGSTPVPGSVHGPNARRGTHGSL